MPDYEINRKIFFAFSQAQKAILSMTNSHVTLEDVFLELTADQGRRLQRSGGPCRGLFPARDGKRQ